MLLSILRTVHHPIHKVIMLMLGHATKSYVDQLFKKRILKGGLASGIEDKFVLKKVQHIKCRQSHSLST